MIQTNVGDMLGQKMRVTRICVGDRGIKILPLILCSLSRCRTNVVCFIGNIFVLSSCDLNFNFIYQSVRY